MSNDLIIEQSGDAMRLTLNRPQRRNALSMSLSAELAGALEKARDATDIKYLIIKGAGEHFCAGDDITEMPKWGNANDVMRRVRYYQHMANTLEELDKITIAAVDGMAVGGEPAVDLDHVGTEGGGREERLDRVLPVADRLAPMADREDHCTTPARATPTAGSTGADAATSWTRWPSR